MLPDVHAVIERRLLVNYRVDPAVVAGLLPSGMRPVLVRGYAVAGICMIRLGHARPSTVPSWLGLRSESAAHRFAVEWDDPSGPATGVYISRRDSASLVNVLAGGRLYPGAHHRARFDVTETRDRVRVACTSLDGVVDVVADVTLTDELHASELFPTLDDASEFFRRGSVGYSPSRAPSRLEGLELRTDAWAVEAARMQEVRSSYFDDASVFPCGSLELDCALVMRSVPVTWHRQPSRETASVDLSGKLAQAQTRAL